MKILALVLITALILTGCTAEIQELPEQTECQIDSDCVPAQCCHSTSCVSKENAPDCSMIFCTQECKPDTLDCGQGSCKCQENQCIAVFK